MLGGIQFSAAFPKGDFSQYVSFSKDFSEGYRYNTDYDITNLFYQNSYERGGHKLSFIGLYGPPLWRQWLLRQPGRSGSVRRGTNEHSGPELRA